ncbi:MAG: hypothetical protein HQK54_16740 [Oligoflexales bacterium]|nr:hypothetical protein [Oligoflexales bacterium]
MSQTFLSFLRKASIPENNLEINLIDHIGTYLDVARIGYEALEATALLRTKKIKIEVFLSTLFKMNLERNDPDELIIFGLGYVWNELSKKKKVQDLFYSLISRLSQSDKKVLVFLLEPANQMICRSAMEFRESLTEAGYHPVYPCTHNKSCPMLQRTRDWCYSEGLWNRPPELIKIDDLMEIDRSKLKSASYVFSSKALTKALNLHFQEKSVIVGRPQKTKKIEKGGHTYTKKVDAFEYLVCSSEGLSKVPHKKEATLMFRGSFL